MIDERWNIELCRKTPLLCETGFPTRPKILVRRLPKKTAQLRQWCADATAASAAEGGQRYGFVYVDQEGFEQHRPQSFAGLVTSFREHQETA